MPEPTRATAQQSPPVRPRRAWLAVFLSFLVPGAGHLYCGDLRGAMLFWLAVCAASTIVKLSYALYGYSTSMYLSLLLLVSVGSIGIAARSAWLAARSRPSGYPLHYYQRLWVVLVASVVMFELPSALQRAFVMQAVHIPTDAMAPTLVKGDYLFVTKCGNRARPERGALAAFRYTLKNGDGGTVVVIKRLVAVAGDRVEVRDGDLWVNDERASLPSAPRPTAPLTVPPEHIYLLGDNTSESGLDSRTLGPIPLAQYVGRAQGIYLSSSIARIGMTF